MAILDVNIKHEKLNNGIKQKDLEIFYKSLNNYVLSVGVHSDKGAELVKRAKHTEFGGYWNEPPFGASGTVPPRPAIRMYLYQDMKEEINSEYQLAINREKDTKVRNPQSNAEKTLSKLGELCVIMQRNKMANGGYYRYGTGLMFNPENNGEKTIAYKGFDNPWIQTGQTISAVDYKVRKRGV